MDRGGVLGIPATFCVLSKLSSFLPRPLWGKHSYPCAHTTVNQHGWAQRPPSKWQERHNEEILCSPQALDPTSA